MTDTAITPVTDTATPGQVRTNTTGEEFLQVDPGTLLIGTNVRTDTRPDAKDFAASIKARGVLEVITAHRDDDGQLVVDRGQRRAVVAARVGTPTGTVPVRVVPAPVAADRIADQVNENVHRAGMHEREVRDAIDQLALCGVSAAQIAKRTALPRRSVDAAITVTRSPRARERMDQVGLTLDEAAIFAEFDGDEDATRTLTEALDRRSWQPLAHAAQRLRDEAAETAAVTTEAERLRGEGVPALDPGDTPQDYYGLRLTGLRTDDGHPVPQDTWPTIPGAAVVVRRIWAYRPSEAAEEPDEPTGRHDDNSEDDLAEDDEDDDLNYAGVGERVQVFDPVWICLDPPAAGLHAATGYGITTRTGPTSAAAPTPEAEDAARDAKRAERRLVIDNNKAWRSAEAIRRAWLRDFVTRTTPPTGAEALICEALITAPSSMQQAMQQHHPRLRTILGIEDRWGAATDGLQRQLHRATAPRAATMLALAGVLAAWEDATDVHTWRNPTAWDHRVMQALTNWGYEPAHVETLLTRTPEPDTTAPEPTTDSNADNGGDDDDQAATPGPDQHTERADES